MHETVKSPKTPSQAGAKRGGIKITKIELLPLSIPHGGGLASVINCVVCKIHTNEGFVGISETGACSPFYNGEVQGSIMAIIADVIGPQALIGEDPCRIEYLVGRMDYLVRGNNHAKSLIDFALHDLKGKILGVPACELLGGRTVDRLKMGWVVAAQGVDQAVQTSVMALQNGFAFVKLKVGVNGVSLNDDIRRLAAVREAIGSDAELQVDANGAWMYNQALESLRAFERFNITLIEQPLPPWDIEGLARLRSKTGIPVFADEAANDPTTLLPLLDRKAVDGLFLKVSKVGGMLKAHRWLTIAEAAGLRVHCGCMAGSGVEAAAFAHVLGAHNWSAKFAHENTGPLIRHRVWNTTGPEITDDLALNVPRYKDGYGFLPEGPGLGVDLNERVVAQWPTPGLTPVVIDASTAARSDGYRS